MISYDTPATVVASEFQLGIQSSLELFQQVVQFFDFHNRPKETAHEESMSAVRVVQIGVDYGLHQIIVNLPSFVTFLSWAPSASENIHSQNVICRQVALAEFLLYQRNLCFDCVDSGISPVLVLRLLHLWPFLWRSVGCTWKILEKKIHH